jgi:hypothetical protein
MSNLPPQNLIAPDLWSSTMVIPASTTALTKESFENATCVEFIRFEAGSQLRRLESGTFVNCRSLLSICIAASVEFIATGCFAGSHRAASSPIKFVTFEPGSELREIEPGAFCGCRALLEITVPASVEKMSLDSLPGRDSGCSLRFEAGNPHFAQRDGLLMDLDHNCILQYRGTRSSVTIPDKIEKINEDSFRDSSSLQGVKFGSFSKLCSIEDNVFHSCNKLRQINMPASVTFIGCSCFAYCHSLRVVSFGSDSQLRCISDGAFEDCCFLESIDIPSRVRLIGASCFAGCSRLADLSFTVDAEIIRIDERAFKSCSALKSLFIPSSVEFVGRLCFQKCGSLTSLTFGSRSHLRELLDVPCQLSGSVAIPDSVEIRCLCASFRPHGDQVFSFGVESKLDEMAGLAVISEGFSSQSESVSNELGISNERVSHGQFLGVFSHETLCPDTVLY